MLLAFKSDLKQCGPDLKLNDLPPYDKTVVFMCMYLGRFKKIGILELLIRQWLREILFGLEFQEAMARDTSFGTNSEVRKPLESWSR